MAVDPAVLAAFQSADKAGRKSLLDDYGPDWKGGLFKALGIPAGMTGWDAAQWSLDNPSAGGGGGGAGGGAGGGGGGSPAPAPAGGGGNPDLSLGNAVRKSEADYNATKGAINDAYNAGVITPEAVQGLQSQAFQNTRAQYARLRRGTVESGYGRVNTGALQGRLRDVNMGEIKDLGAGSFRINQGARYQNANMGRWKAGAYADLMSRRQIPYMPQASSIPSAQPSAQSSTPPTSGFRYRPAQTYRKPDYNNAWGY